MLKVFRNEKSGEITSLRTGEVVFSYAFLTRPRPEDDFKAGYYGADLVIQDEATLKAIKAYIKETMELNLDTKFGGKIGKNFHIPLRAGDPEVDIEEGKFVLKTNTKFQPQVLIVDKITREAREITEDEVDEIYSGMVGEAFIKFKPYSYNGQKGLSCYLSAVLKTKDGDPLGNKLSYADMFSDTVESLEDTSEDIDPVEAVVKVETSVKPKSKTKEAPKKGKEVLKKGKEEPEEAPDIDLDSLIEGPSSVEDEDQEDIEITIDDLL
jgi:hypothetical protein